MHHVSLILFMQRNKHFKYILYIRFIVKFYLYHDFITFLIEYKILCK